MSRVIIFSRTFPKYHPKAGEPTYFVEKFINSIDLTYLEHGKKYHTIRAGHRWKVGDKFSPRIWSGDPYKSKQIIIAPDIEIKKVFYFMMEPMLFWDECRFYINCELIDKVILKKVAANDGLNLPEFVCWFAGPSMANTKRKAFDGQIICWNENINYT